MATTDIITRVANKSHEHDERLSALERWEVPWDVVFAGDNTYTGDNSFTRIYITGVGATNGVFIGGDCQIYRSGTNQLTTPDSLVIGGSLSAGAISGSSLDVGGGSIDGGAIGGSSLSVTGNISAGGTVTGDKVIGNVNGTGGGVEIGSDCQIYRSGTNTMTTPDSLVISGTLDVTGNISTNGTVTGDKVIGNTNGTGGGVQIGSDCQIYRSGVNSMTTTDDFTSTGNIEGDNVTANTRVYIGSASSFIQNVAGRLELTGATLYVPQGINIAHEASTSNGFFRYKQLQSRPASTNYNVYAFYPLTTLVSSSSYFGGSKGSTGGSTHSASSQFSGVPSDAKALSLAIACQHSSGGQSVQIGPNSAGRYALEAITPAANVYGTVAGICPLASGNFYIITSVIFNNLYVRCSGYFV